MVVRVYEYVLSDNIHPLGMQVDLNDDYPIPPGWVRADTLAKLRSVKNPLFPDPSLPVLTQASDVPLGSVPDNYGASIQGKRLTAEGEKIKAEWDHLYKAKGCTCHDGLVCAHCAHPGHPYSLENNTKLWEDIPKPSRADLIMEAIRAAAGRKS